MKCPCFDGPGTQLHFSRSKALTPTLLLGRTTECSSPHLCYLFFEVEIANRFLNLHDSSTLTLAFCNLDGVLHKGISGRKNQGLRRGLRQIDEREVQQVRALIKKSYTTKEFVNPQMGLRESPDKHIGLVQKLMKTSETKMYEAYSYFHDPTCPVPKGCYKSFR